MKENKQQNSISSAVELTAFGSRKTKLIKSEIFVRHKKIDVKCLIIYFFTQLISNVNRIKAIFMVIPQLNDHYTQFLTY